MAPGAELQLIDGVLQVLLATALFFTFFQRRENRLLFGAGIFFGVLGLLNVLVFGAERIGGIFSGARTELFEQLVYHLSLFFGAAAYVWIRTSVNVGSLPARILRIVLIAGLAVFLVIHIAPLEIFSLPPHQHALISALADASMPWFFVIVLIILTGLFVRLWWKIHQQKTGGLPYTANMWTGFSLIYCALIVKQTLDAMPGIPHSDLLFMVAMIVAIGGFVTQISLALLPGMVYDAQNRHPVALARVDAYKDNKVVGSAVSRADGRYELLLEAGVYQIKVRANGYAFPSRLSGTYQGVPVRVLRPMLSGIDLAVDRSRT